MNLHGIFRNTIPSINPDVAVVYVASAGAPTVNAAGKSTSSYASPVNVRAQVQPVTGQDLRKYDFLQAQGIYRAVYLFGDIEGIVRSAQKGGDLLKFPMSQAPGSTVYTWLVRQVDETWTSDATQGGWCRVIVVQQLDPNNPP
jgi:hypothetical protein